MAAISAAAQAAVARGGAAAAAETSCENENCSICLEDVGAAPARAGTEYAKVRS